VLGAATVIGLMALVIYPPSEAFDSVLGGDAYNIMPVFLTTEFPDWALVIMFGLLAALVMSTVATFTNVCALNLSYDILQPLVYRKRGWSDSRIVFFSRFASLIMVALAVAVAFGIDYLPTGLWDAYYISSGLLSAGVAVPVLAMFWKRATFAGAFAGSLVGAILAFVFYMLEYYVFEFVYWPQWLADTALGYCVVAVIGGTLTLIVVSLLTPKSPQEKLDAISAQPVDDHEEFFAGVRAHGG
jgi:SSS family solute:Na+ symporter